MPQMAPMWWEILFIMFIMSFMMLNTIIYYNKILAPKYKFFMKKTVNQLKWMW